MQRHIGKDHGITLLNNPSQIGSNWALTAAHCIIEEKDYYDETDETVTYEIDLIPASQLSLLLGVHDKSLLTEPTRQKVSVSKVLIHEDYNVTSHENDIALLKLGEAPGSCSSAQPSPRGEGGPLHLPTSLPAQPERLLHGKRGERVRWDPWPGHCSSHLLYGINNNPDNVPLNPNIEP